MEAISLRTNNYENQMEMKLTILHTNDIHGMVDTFPKIATVVLDCLSKGEKVLLLDAGDTLYTSRVPEATIPKTEAILRLMADIGYEAWTPGNRDLAPAHSEEVLQDLSKASPFPFLAANVPSSISDGLAAFAQPYHFVKVGNDTIGILGLVPGYSNPQKALDFFLPMLKEKSHMVIGLLHFGSNHMANISLSPKGFDIVLGGHSHEVTPEPKIIEGVPYFQAGVFGKYMLRVEVLIEPKGMKLWKSSLIALDETEPNAPKAQKFIEDNRDKFNEPCN